MNRVKYIELYLKDSGLKPRELTRELGYGKNQVLNWLSGYRGVSNYAMNHLILLRKDKKRKVILMRRRKLEALRNKDK